MSNELNQYSCHPIYMFKIQKDITIFACHDILPGVYDFITGSVRKWIIAEKDLILMKNSVFKVLI